jgi:hypothetical protein
MPGSMYGVATFEASASGLTPIDPAHPVNGVRKVNVLRIDRGAASLDLTITGDEFCQVAFVGRRATLKSKAFQSETRGNRCRPI